jgi:hypothetical protein
VERESEPERLLLSHKKVMMFVCRISFRLLPLHLHAFEIGELALLGRRHALLVSGKETAMRLMTLARPL